MLKEDERKILERKAAKIVALINLENWTEAILQTQNVAADLVQIRNSEIKKGNYKG